MHSMEKIHQANKLNRLKDCIFRTNLLQDRENIVKRKYAERSLLLRHPPDFFYTGKSLFNLNSAGKRRNAKYCITRSIAVRISGDYLKEFVEFKGVKGCLGDHRVIQSTHFSINSLKSFIHSCCRLKAVVSAITFYSRLLMKVIFEKPKDSEEIG